MTIPLLRAVIRFNVALFLALLCAHSAAAQSEGKDTYSRREILTAPPVWADSAGKSCLLFGSARWSPDVYQPGNCRALGCSVVGATRQNRWSACAYEHDWISPASAAEPSDILREVEVVLYRLSGSQPDSERDRAVPRQLTPVWHEVYEPEFLRSVTTSVTAVNGRGSLLTVQECVNGTGGCQQSFMLDVGGEWHPVKLTFLQSVGRRYPDADHIAFHVNPRTLSAEVWLYSEKDPNCCPSRSVTLSLRLRGEAMEAKTISGSTESQHLPGR